MSFTDEMLKEVKDGMSTLRMTMDVTEYSMNAEWLEAMIKRLEAAEKVCHVMQRWQEDGLAECDLLQEWLASRGEKAGE